MEVNFFTSGGSFLEAVTENVDAIHLQPVSKGDLQ